MIGKSEAVRDTLVFSGICCKKLYKAPKSLTAYIVWSFLSIYISWKYIFAVFSSSEQSKNNNSTLTEEMYVYPSQPGFHSHLKLKIVLL